MPCSSQNDRRSIRLQQMTSITAVGKSSRLMPIRSRSCTWSIHGALVSCPCTVRRTEPTTKSEPDASSLATIVA